MPRRFAVIECEDSPKWADGFSSFMLPAFKEGADGEEEWVVFKTAIDGSLPAPGEHFDGLVLTGSHYNTRDNTPWQAPLMEYLRGAYVPPGGDAAAAAAAAAGGDSGGAGAMPAPPRAATRVVGICYGHQLIAATFGGQVDYNEGGGFVLKAERVTPTPALAAQRWAADFVEVAPDGATARVRDVRDDVVSSSATTEQVLAAARDAPWVGHLGLLESHGDCVRELPPGAVLLASSPSCRNEIVLTGANFLSTQGHPEFELRSCIVDRIWPAVVGERKRLDEAQQAEALASFEAPRHSCLLLEMLRRFLKGRG